jgi:F-box-like
MYVFHTIFAVTTADQCDVGQVAIDILPDDILLCIFNVYIKDPYEGEEWHTLVHVCRRWRTLVFGSPHHLNLKLVCTPRTPVTEKLDIWPALPIVLYHHFYPGQKMDNLIAALKYNDRVCKIDFRMVLRLEEVVSVMQVPFPALTDLTLFLFERATVIPDLFLGGSAPRLQHLYLDCIPFPGLPKLLLSATHLVSLCLHNLPHSCYISPDAMATCLSALVRLKHFSLEFESPQSRQDRENRHLPPPTHILLPALTLLRFQGAHKYVEDLMALIDAPSLHCFHITFFNETVPNIPNLFEFINRIPKFQALDDARVTLSDDEVRVTLSDNDIKFTVFGDEIRVTIPEGLVLGISWDRSVGHLSSLARNCRPFLPAIATVEQLYIYGDRTSRALLRWSEIQHSHWLELLHLFTGAKNLYLSKDLVPYISPVLRQLVEERTTETTQVLPALQNLFLYEFQQQRPVEEGIESFVAARQLSGRPIVVRSWSG